MTARTADGASARRLRTGLGVLILVCQIIAAQASAFEPLPRTPPEALGIDAAGIDQFLHDLEQVPGAQSVLVVHRNRVVAEAYWTGSAATLRHLRSVTKSVTSTLIGIAVDRGFIGDIDRRMVDYLPPSLVPSDRAKDSILLVHLLTHSSGLKWNENQEFAAWANSSDPVRFILDRPLVSTPGTTFNYSTLDLVVAANASFQVDAAQADAQERAILGAIVEKLLPLIPVRHRPPHRSSGRVGPLLDPKTGTAVPDGSQRMPTDR